jgi:hypothetical protein
MLNRIWNEDSGVLSFEWILLLTLLTIGIVSGLAGARDAIVDELGDIAGAATCFDQSYSVPALSIGDPPISAPLQQFADSIELYETCDRTDFIGQPHADAGNDVDS